MVCNFVQNLEVKRRSRSAGHTGSQNKPGLSRYFCESTMVCNFVKDLITNRRSGFAMIALYLLSPRTTQIKPKNPARPILLWSPNKI